MEPDEEQPTDMGATTTVAAAAGSVVGANGAESPPPPRKRLKLTLADDAVALRKRILEHKLIRLKNMRERLTEQLSELYFLQAGGNMMDYAAWRKRPPTPQLLAFLDARRPPALVSGSAPALTSAVLHPTSSVSSSSGPAPVPATVSAPTHVPVQTQRLPNGTGEDKRHATLVVRTQSGGAEVHQSQKQDSALLELDVAASTGAPTASLAPNNAQEEIVEKAKQEAYVARRVAELARAGLWTERRLPRVLEPPRPKTHWDYLLEEMAWLAQDFANERKWKKHAAKKCARMVQKHFQDKAVAAQRAEKAHELQLRRIAAFAAKEIKSFWTNIEKVVEWKRSIRLERARKAALDEQLSYIVDRTERYSQQLAAGMSRSATSSVGVLPSDDEFEPGSGSNSSDDEETIAAAERDNTDTRDEVDALRRESRLELRDVLRTLPPGYRPGAPPSPPVSAASSASASISASASASRASSPAPSDYSAAGDHSTDDETTIAEEERTETVDATAELDALRRESEMSIEDLLRSYRADGDVAPVTPATPVTPTTDTHSDTNDEANTDSSTNDEDDSDTASEHSSAPSETLEALVAEPATEHVNKETNGGAEEERVQAAAALAATLQPTGTTLSETAVGTPVPRLLRGGALREYQHVGLHWLATMHARGLNGILADEMGLGKTIQTIALLAHLALERGDWGPHLVIAPTSLVLNWELEFKKWCPAFKLLTYYGTIKERKLKRVGWTKANCFHVCITSYKLVVQDHQSFRRKRWKYLILDEAQNIKNFKSQRWQMLLNFQTERRLLLTGTPLQNSLLELWSLMHFLMPDVFASHSEFREWFAPVAGIAEGSHKYNEDIVRRLHKVLRPFLLRRLKADVERQMPRKYEHVLLCRLSKRQRYLYDDFMSRAKTKESLASGNLLSVINVLMQLRKVCNHPDLFEPRAVHSPLQLSGIELRVPAFLLLSDERSAFAATLGGDLATLEATGAEAFVSHRARHLAPPRRLIEELPADEAAHTPPPPPPVARKLRLHLRLVARTPAARLTAPRVAPAPLHLPVPPSGSSPPAQPPLQASAARPYNSYNEACAARLEARRRASLRRLGAVNERRCWRLPLYGADLRAAAAAPSPIPIEAAVAPPTLDEFVTRLVPTLERFSVCWEAARAPAPQLVVGAGAAVWRRHLARLDERAVHAAQPLLRVLHLPTLLQSVAFPHPRLLQYDCGKLQTLDALLRRLKGGGHRVLIFTQMTRVLDVLEAFLSMHGHTYLRLDGATRVDRRQPLVDRFNSDSRLFAFILSTRSGGVGLNLAGADCVIFYDSDWNPTMDAQAQDRCHRIGQTRDVHVYRLVTAATVEENILRKAEQKRALGHLAIEDGHFTTSYLRAANIHELFGEAATPAANVSSASADLESALAAAEDEADAAAANAARAEAQRDLAEFDETLPLVTDDGEDGAPAVAPDEDQPRELRTLLQQLRPVEKYAMRILENSESAAEAERVAREHVERQRDEWQSARRALQREPSPPPPPPDSPLLDLTYTRADARNQVWLTAAGRDRMPMWCPPTPPQGDGDVYMESWTRALYRPGAAPGDLLPPTARPPPRTPRSPRPRRHLQRVPLAPASLFDRAAPRVRSRLRHHPHVAATHAPHAPHPHPHPALDWSPAEDAALRRGLRLQRLSTEPPAAHIPNWEWVADLVADVARVYRTARACRDRHEAACGDDHRAHRKQKKGKPRHDETAPRPPLARIESMREAAERRRRAPKRRYEDPSPHSAKHAALLADLGVDYDKPPSPMEVATRRAERIAKEKLKAGGSSTVSQPTSVAAPTPPPAQPPNASSAPTPTVASAALHHAPQRIVVAAHPVATLIKGGSVSGVAGASTSGTTQLYRQQALARHQLKILQQAAPGAAAGSAGEALRTLQLQQLAVGRARSQQAAVAAPGIVSAAGAAGPTSRPPHVVVAHLTHPQHLRQSSSPVPVSTATSAVQTTPAPAAHNQNDLTDRQ